MLFSQKISGGNSIASWATAALTLLPALLCSASPTPVDIHVTKNPQHDLIFREALEIAHQPHLEKRLQADFSLDKTWEKNHVLFAGSWINSGGALGTAADTVSLAVTCIDCWTRGTVSASLREDLVDPSVRLDFSGVEAHVDVGVDITAGAAYAVNLFTSHSPLGLGFPGLSVGLVFYVDLVFSLTSEIDLEGGFHVRVADGAYLEASVFGGDVTDSFFDGLATRSLPVVVSKGSATFKADLRLRVQCGAELGMTEEMGMGAVAELGIYANLIEYVAVLEKTPTCELQSRQWWDLNVGAFARLGVVVDYKTFGLVPTVSTTLLTAPTLTHCWVDTLPTAGGGTVATAPAEPVSLWPSSSSPLGVGVGGPSGATTSGSYSGGGGSLPTSSSSPSSSVLPNFPAGNSSTYPIYTTGDISPSPAPLPPNGDLVTSIIYSTTQYTMTSCAAAVPNCPTSLQNVIVVTRTLDSYTTVCPATAVITAIPSSFSPSSSSSSPLPALSTTTVEEDAIVLVPCKTPIVETFTYTPPAVVTATATSAEGYYTTAPSGGGYQYRFPNGSAVAISRFSTLAPSDILVPSAGGSGAGTIYAVPVPSEYPAVTAGAAGGVGRVGILGLVVGGLAWGVAMW